MMDMRAALPHYAAGVGVAEDVPALAALLGGVLVFVPFMMAYRFVLQTTGAFERVLLAGIRANLGWTLTDPWRRWVVFGALIAFNPVTEELVLRGLLVHHASLFVAPLWLTVALGAVVNAIAHSYQGRWLTLFHLAFYTVSVALLLSPLGLLGAIGLHYAADAAPLLSQRNALQRYKALRRERRRLAAQGQLVQR